MIRMFAAGALAGAALAVATPEAEAVLNFPVTMDMSWCSSGTTCTPSNVTSYTFQANGTWSNAQGYTGRWHYFGNGGVLGIVYDSGTFYVGRSSSPQCLDGIVSFYTGLEGAWSGCVN